jgi:hypothetical protein
VRILMKRRLIAIVLSVVFTFATAGTALAGHMGGPHAGHSGNFKNPSAPCQNNPDHPKCPPHGG